MYTKNRDEFGDEVDEIAIEEYYHKMEIILSVKKVL